MVSITIWPSGTNSRRAACKPPTNLSATLSNRKRGFARPPRSAIPSLIAAISTAICFRRPLHRRRANLRSRFPTSHRIASQQPRWPTAAASSTRSCARSLQSIPPHSRSIVLKYRKLLFLQRKLFRPTISDATPCLDNHPRYSTASFLSRTATDEPGSASCHVALEPSSTSILNSSLVS